MYGETCNEIYIIKLEFVSSIYSFIVFHRYVLKRAVVIPGAPKVIISDNLSELRTFVLWISRSSTD